MAKKRSEGSLKYHQFGPRLRLARERLGLTQADLARRVDLTQEFIAQLEAGKHLPQLSRAYDLAAALHVTLDELIGGAHEPRTVHYHTAGEVTVSVSNGGLVVLGNYRPADIEHLLKSWGQLREQPRDGTVQESA